MTRGRLTQGLSRPAGRRRHSPLPRLEPLEVRVLLSGDPTLTVVLGSATMSEIAGGNGVSATVQRTNTDLSQALTVNLQSSDTTEATVPLSIVIPAGATSAGFLVMPADDSLLDGPQTLQITASAPGFIYSSSTLTTSGLDTTYGSNGYSSVPLAWSSTSVYPDIVIQPNGASVALAQTPGSSTSWSLVRRTANGAVDASFGGNGVVATTFANVTGVSPTALALQTDGKILAVGHVSGGTTIWNDMVAVRYNANGTLDTTFGDGGILRIERTTHTNIIDVSILSDGSILLVGAEANGGFIAKLTASGTLDTTFGTDGVVLTPLAGYSAANFKSLNIQSDGSILAAGTATATGSNLPTFFVARYLADGTLDTSYGADGLQFVDVNPAAATSSSLTNAVLQSDGKLLLVGYDRVNSTANENWAIARLNVDGSLDTSFSTDGVTLLDFNGFADYARDVVVQADGKILVMGEGFVSGNGHDLAVARFNSNGTLDTTFDGDGKLTLPNWSNTIWEQIWAGQLTADGQLVFVAGYGDDMRVGRLNLNTPAPARDILTVTDYETLIVSIAPTTVSENAGAAAVTGTVTRSNVSDLSSALTVTLLSNDTTELTVPATIVIEAGQSSATFAIDVVNDTITDGTQRVTISASASGYVLFSDTLSVTDDDTNIAPVAAAQSRSVSEDAVLNGQVSATDANGNPLTYSIVTGASKGQVTMNSSGAYVYTPAANFNGTDSFQFRAFDGLAYSNTATVTISVQAVNDVPVAVNDSYTLNEDTVLVTSPVSQPITSIQMTSDPGDYIGQGKTYNLSNGITASAANNGSLVRVRYQSPTNGSDYWSFDFESPGANVPLAVGTYSGATRYPFNPEGTPGLSVTGQGRGSNTLTGTFTIHAISFAPNGMLQCFSASFEQHSEGSTPALRGTVNYNYTAGGPAGVLANDSDVDGNQLIASLVTLPQHGTVTLNANGTFTYTPQANYHGPDSFTYVAGDGALTSELATVFLTVNSVEDSPTIADQTFAIDENTVPMVSIGMVVASDGDAGQSLTYAITDSTHPGTFAIDAQTGELTLVDGTLLDYEQASSAVVTVTVTDSGNPARFSSADVTININDVNDRPAILTQTLSVDENAANGTSLGMVAVLEQDAGQTLTYYLLDDSNGAFSINSSTGEVAVANGALLNFESMQTQRVIVEVIDNGSPALSSIRDVTVLVRDINEAPILFAPPISVAENAQDFTHVGNVYAMDVDADQSLVYSITESTLPGAFAIDPAYGAILIADGSLLDYESAQTVTLTVTATDNGNPALSTSTLVTVTLIDMNEVPTIVNQAFTINENVANGTVVGTLVASDVDAGQTLTYYMGGSSLEGAFEVIAATGEIIVADSSLLNYEAVGTVSFQVAVVDSGNPTQGAVADVTITIQDMNDAPVLADQSFAVREYLNSGSVVGTMTAFDEDAGQSLIYSIESSSLPDAFMIHPFTGEILVANAMMLDHETVTSVTMTVRATDSGNPSSSTTATVVIAINDVNESPEMAAQSFSVAENAANGTVVGTVLATDIDAGQSLTYEIFNSPVPGAFAINAATGEITVLDGSLLDFESRSSIELAILVSDNGTPTLATFAPITINLTNVNEAPVVTAATFSTAENRVNGTAIGTVAASDPDSGQTRTFAITAGNTNNAFTINATTGVLTVNNSAALNFESTPTFSLTITATDNGTPAKSGSATVTVNLTNVNEAPVVTGATFSATENSANGTIVGTVAASDDDSGQTRTYAITAGNTNNAFAINATTGVVTVNNSAALNFESTPTFSLTITATDNGTPARSGSATVTVNLTNVNEAPVITTQSLAVKTKAKAGAVVGTVTSSDPDAGQTRTYSIVSGNGNNVFAINAATGVITVKSASGVKSARTYDLVVRVTDNGSPTLSSTGTVRIYVNSTGKVPAGSLAALQPSMTTMTLDSADESVLLVDASNNPRNRATTAPASSAQDKGNPWKEKSGGTHSSQVDDFALGSIDENLFGTQYDELYSQIDTWF